MWKDASTQPEKKAPMHRSMDECILCSMAAVTVAAQVSVHGIRHGCLHACCYHTNNTKAFLLFIDMCGICDVYDIYI